MPTYLVSGIPCTCMLCHYTHPARDQGLLVLPCSTIVSQIENEDRKPNAIDTQLSSQTLFPLFISYSEIVVVILVLGLICIQNLLCSNLIFLTRFAVPFLFGGYNTSD